MQKSVLLVFSTIVVAVSAAILMLAGTLLFTRESYVDYHITAGSLELAVEQVKAEGQVHQTDYTGKNAYNQVVDLTKEGSKIFSIDNFCPMDWHEATIKITNTGNIDITYTVSITGVEATSVRSVALLSQVKIYVYHSNGMQLESFWLSEVLESDSDTRVLKVGRGKVLNCGEGASDTFRIKAVFMDHEDNNLAMGGKLNFDIVVDAVQADIYE